MGCAYKLYKTTRNYEVLVSQVPQPQSYIQMVPQAMMQPVYQPMMGQQFNAMPMGVMGQYPQFAPVGSAVRPQ